MPSEGGVIVSVEFVRRLYANLLEVSVSHDQRLLERTLDEVGRLKDRVIPEASGP